MGSGIPSTKTLLTWWKFSKQNTVVVNPNPGNPNPGNPRNPPSLNIGVPSRFLVGCWVLYCSGSWSVIRAFFWCWARVFPVFVAIVTSEKTLFGLCCFKKNHVFCWLSFDFFASFWAFFSKKNVFVCQWLCHFLVSLSFSLLFFF